MQILHILYVGQRTTYDRQEAAMEVGIAFGKCFRVLGTGLNGCFSRRPIEDLHNTMTLHGQS